MVQVMNGRNNLRSQQRHRLTQTYTSGACLPSTSLVVFFTKIKTLEKAFTKFAV
jgi:hypothetical protein